MKYFSSSPEDTERVGADIAKTLKAGNVLALQGGLGAGKTAFTRGLCRGIGISARVSSPTYAILNRYEGIPAVCHFDLYRLSGADDLYDIGFFDYIDSGDICVVEWSERANGVLPEDTIFIDIEFGEKEDERVITVKRHGEAEL